MRYFSGYLAIALMGFGGVANAAMTDYAKVRLRSLDKITARTMTFDARVGTTIKFGSMYIKILSCQKPDVAERNDAVSFLQIWEITPDDLSKWIFSGWMFASSPALSAMDHPIYDVWVIDCFADTLPDAQKKNAETTPPAGPGIEDVLKGAVGHADLVAAPLIPSGTAITTPPPTDSEKGRPASEPEVPGPQSPEPDSELPPMVDQDFERQGH